MVSKVQRSITLSKEYDDAIVKIASDENRNISNMIETAVIDFIKKKRGEGSEK